MQKENPPVYLVVMHYLNQPDHVRKILVKVYSKRYKGFEDFANLVVVLVLDFIRISKLTK